MGGSILVRLALLTSSSIKHLNKVSTKLGATQVALFLRPLETIRFDDFCRPFFGQGRMVFDN